MTELELFTVENEKVVPSVALYNIPELKILLDTYPKEAMNMFSYLYYTHYPKSPYANLTDEEREDALDETYGGSWSTEDPYFRIADDLVNRLYTTPTKKFFLNAKMALEKLGDYLANASIVDGKDGNLGHYSMAMTRIGKTMDDFKKLEKMYQDESGNDGTRGNKSVSYDD
jgi:hypothetical protein